MYKEVGGGRIKLIVQGEAVSVKVEIPRYIVNSWKLETSFHLTAVSGTWCILYIVFNHLTLHPWHFPNRKFMILPNKTDINLLLKISLLLWRTLNSFHIYRIHKQKTFMLMKILCFISSYDIRIIHCKNTILKMMIMRMIVPEESQECNYLHICLLPTW